MSSTQSISCYILSPIYNFLFSIVDKVAPKKIPRAKGMRDGPFCIVD